MLQFARDNLVIIIIVLFAILSLNGCSSRKKEVIPYRTAVFKKVEFNSINMWKYDDHLAALRAFHKSCVVFARRKANANIGRYTNVGGKVRDWQAVCLQIPNYTQNSTNARIFFEKFFNIYQVSDIYSHFIGDFTGYYEVELYGSLQPSAIYKYPVYRPPHNIRRARRVSRFSKDAIDSGTLKNQGLEIAWVTSKRDLVAMHIQGSGVILLNNKRVIRLRYHSENGFSYETKRMFSKPKDQSYVFFEERSTKSPVGAQGVELSAGRSIAIDHRTFPYGVPFWVETVIPGSGTKQHCNYHRLMIAQDTGGRIKGSVRADLFFGRGQQAEYFAKRMRNKGRYYALFPKSVAVVQDLKK